MARREGGSTRRETRHRVTRRAAPGGCTSCRPRSGRPSRENPPWRPQSFRYPPPPRAADPRGSHQEEAPAQHPPCPGATAGLSFPATAAAPAAAPTMSAAFQVDCRLGGVGVGATWRTSAPRPYASGSADPWRPPPPTPRGSPLPRLLRGSHGAGAIAACGGGIPPLCPPRVQGDGRSAYRDGDLEEGHRRLPRSDRLVAEPAPPPTPAHQRRPLPRREPHAAHAPPPPAPRTWQGQSRSRSHSLDDIVWAHSGCAVFRAQPVGDEPVTAGPTPRQRCAAPARLHEPRSPRELKRSGVSGAACGRLVPPTPASDQGDGSRHSTALSGAVLQPGVAGREVDDGGAASKRSSTWTDRSVIRVTF